MDIKQFESRFKHLRDYGSNSTAISKFRELTGKKENVAIQSTNTSITSFNEKINESNQTGKSSGSSIRCFSSSSFDKFYSMESINIDKGGRIEGFTKYIGFGNGANLSPLVRFDFGGDPHGFNRISNKYFENNVPTPHIHFCRLNTKNRIEENAIDFDHLISYLKDLGQIKDSNGKLVNGEPENDINTNSYGMPYLDIKLEYEQKYGKDNKEFNLLIVDMIEKLENSKKLFQYLTTRKLQLKSTGQENIQTDINIQTYKSEILSNISEITLQSNLKNYFDSQLLKLKQSQNESNKNNINEEVPGM